MKDIIYAGMLLLSSSLAYLGGEYDEVEDCTTVEVQDE